MYYSVSFKVKVVSDFHLRVNTLGNVWYIFWDGDFDKFLAAGVSFKAMSLMLELCYS